MTEMFIDAISNVRLVQGTIRLDTMKIVGKKEDGSYAFEKIGEVIMTGNSFNQVVKVLKNVESELRDRADTEKKQ
jgi:rRNA processing protein Krr1/Pno1